VVKPPADADGPPLPDRTASTSVRSRQNVAVNHYRAAGCGKGALYICRSGACERDSELLSVEQNERVMTDGARALEVLAAARDAILSCTNGKHLRLEATFGSDGTLANRRYDDAALSPAEDQCVDYTVRQIALGGSPEYPLYVRYVFQP
jgi:hypothetical protein